MEANLKEVMNMKKRIIAITAIFMAFAVTTTTFAFARGREGKKIVVDETNYIGAEKAKVIAFNDAGVEADAVTLRKAKIDKEDGVYVYEVDFCTETEKYEYEINAETGEITEKDVKEKTAECGKTPKADKTAKPKRTPDPDATVKPEGTAKPEKTAKPTVDTTAFIGEEAALEKAFNDAGVEKDAATVKKVKLDEEDGIFVYEVAFTTETEKYEYEINAETGEVVEREAKEKKFEGKPEKKQPTVDTTAFIGEEAAKEKALAAAGVEADAATVKKVKLTREDGTYVYEVKFTTETEKYEFEINAETGEVVEKEAEAKRKGR